MNHSRVVASLVVLVLCAVAPSVAFAQLAPAYTNPLDSSSDTPGWYMEGYPFAFAVDSSPIGGVSGASLNWNNGVDIDGDYPYGYFQAYQLSVQGMQDPIVTWWCRWDLNADPYWDYREIYWWEENNYDYIYKVHNADNDGDGQEDLDCGNPNEWHQHSVALPQTFLQAGTFNMQFYTYSNGYYQGAGYEGWFIDHIQFLVPDVNPPDTVTDLAAANATLTEMEVSWSSPNDDDVSGVTASFDLRMSTSPITSTNFDSATQLNGEPSPDVAGTPHTVLVTGLTEDTTYFFAVRSTDQAGNVSLVSNIASLNTLAPPPPPPPPSSTGGVTEVEENDDILPCSAGTSGSPVGLLALAGLVILAAFGAALRK